MNRPRDDYDHIAETWLLLFAVFCALAPIVFKLGWLR